MKWLPGICVVLLLTAPAYSQEPTRRITYQEYFDKVHGGWTGKALGLAMGVPKEYAEPWPPSPFEYFAQIPDHFSDRASGDDVYVPLVFQLAFQHYGIHPTQEQYLSEWDRRLFSGRIWGSLDQALDHYRAGIKPPKTGLPGYNQGWNDMGSQMSTDLIGWISPGLINTAAQMSSSASRVMNSGVGADGGIFTGALESEAFFTSDPEQVVRKARSVLPAGGQFGEMIDDLLRWRKEEPDWRLARQRMAGKYNPGLNPQDPAGLIQGGVLTLALLYGDGEFAESLLIAQKCAWDSDTNASTVGGILGTMLGLSHLEPRWSMVLHDTYENYCIRGLPRWMTFSDIAHDTVEIGDQVIRDNGGQVTGACEDRVYRIPIQQPIRIEREQPATPALIEENEREMELFYRAKLKGVTDAWDPQWTLTMASFETKPEVLPDYFGRRKVLKVQPGTRGAVLSRTLTLAPHKHHYLRVGVAHHPTVLCEQTGAPEVGSWRLEVLADGNRVGTYNVSTQGGQVVWEDPQFDLTRYAGKTIKLLMIAYQTYAEFYKSSLTSYWSGTEVISVDQPEPWR
jgi:hypothetical protein